MVSSKLKAYTLLEVTVAMLLSAIVISTTYAVYAIVTRSYGAFNTKNKDMAVLIRLDELLNMDFGKAQSITKTDSGLVFDIDKNNITYEFNAGYIIRNSAIKDTFKVEVKGADFLFERANIDEFDNDTTVAIDELRLDLIFEKRNIAKHYYKQYSSENLFRLKNHAVN